MTDLKYDRGPLTKLAGFNEEWLAVPLVAQGSATCVVNEY